MKFNAPLVLLASVTGAMANCYNSNDASWGSEGNRDAARGAVRDLCRGGHLSGWFPQAGHTKTICAPLNGGIRANFAVAWRGGSGGATLASGDCELRLNNEINGCWYGGESTVAGWYFKSDPNYGSC